MLYDVLMQNGGCEVSAIELYSDLFQFDNEFIQKENDSSKDFKANPLGYGKDFDKVKGGYKILFSDTFESNLNFLQERDFAIINGITYFGRKNVQSHASKMFAMILDLDGVDEQGLKNFLFGAGNGFYPIPNYFALSGHGVHLYYLFETPISLYPNIKTQLKDLKYALMRRIWNKSITTEHHKVQYQGINQGFRVIGGKTKVKNKRVKAYKFDIAKYTPNQLAEYVSYETKYSEESLWKENNLKIEDAKKLYPEWYERVVLNKEVLTGHWTCKEDLYNWWLKRVKTEAVVGHRYYCVMCLAIYAAKCNIPEERLKRDAHDLMNLYNQEKDVEPFLESDVESALECFDLKYIKFPIKDISKISALEIVKNKRNGRKQDIHLKGARAIQKINDEDKGISWREGNGRKTKEMIVRQWRIENPTGKKITCIIDTGLSKPTVYKWW